MPKKDLWRSAEDKMVEFKFINFYRALAAFWVLCAHCVIWGGGKDMWFPSPKIAVDLFMVISGFLMTVNAASRAAREPMEKKTSWWRFWIRRFFRIAPAYYLSLLLAVVFAGEFLGGYQVLKETYPDRWGSSDIYDPSRIQFTAENLLWHITFLFGVHPTWSFSTMLPDWSLSLEMQFYLVFPFIYLVAMRFGAARAALALSAFAILSTFVIRNGLGIRFFEPSLILFKLQYFLAGVLLHNAMAKKDDVGPKKIFLNPSICLALVLVFAELKFSRLRGFSLAYGMEAIAMPLLFSGMVYFAFVERATKSLSMPSRIVRRLTENPLMHFASETSYSVYLFHGFMIAIAGLTLFRFDPFLLLSPVARVGVMIVVVAVGSYAAGYLIFRFVETPGIDLGRKVGRKVLG